MPQSLLLLPTLNSLNLKLSDTLSTSHPPTPCRASRWTARGARQCTERELLSCRDPAPARRGSARSGLSTRPQPLYCPAIPNGCSLDCWCMTWSYGSLLLAREVGPAPFRAHGAACIISPGGLGMLGRGCGGAGRRQICRRGRSREGGLDSDGGATMASCTRMPSSCEVKQGGISWLLGGGIGPVESRSS